MKAKKAPFDRVSAGSIAAYECKNNSSFSNNRVFWFHHQQLILGMFLRLVSLLRVFLQDQEQRMKSERIRMEPEVKEGLRVQ